LTKSETIPHVVFMIKSMTGFGLAQFQSEQLSLQVQVKSVNGRFLEVRFKMPREYAALESELKKIITKKIERGSVDVMINREVIATALPPEVKVNVALATAWLNEAKSLAKQLKISDDIRLDSVLKVPDVVTLGDARVLSESEKQQLVSTLSTALENCMKERQREGENLADTCLALLNDLEVFNKDVKGKKDKLAGELKEKIRERILALQEDVAFKVDDNRLSQEVLFLLDKADVAEEVARLEAHIEAFKKSLKQNGAAGKKLEFYTQELHREVNTLGAKTQNLEITLNIIEAKTRVERLREQVQNIE
jgi:uncharacterized protein (TIGR00255 family)